MEKKRLLVLSLALHIVTLLSLIPYAFLLHKAGPAEPEGALMVLLDSFRVLFCLEFLNIVFTGIALVLKGVQFVLYFTMPVRYPFQTFENLMSSST